MLSHYHQGFLRINQIFSCTAYFAELSAFSWDSKFYLLSIFCWVVTRHFCRLSKFLLTQRIFAESTHFADSSNVCSYSIILLMHQILLRQQIFAYSAYFGLTEHILPGIFPDSASFCWHSVFLLNLLIFAATANFLLTQHLLLSHHQAFLLTQQVFGDIAYIC